MSSAAPSLGARVPISEPQSYPVGLGASLLRLVTGRLTLADVWLLLAPLSLLVVLGFTLIRPYDFWWHLRTGQIIVTSGAIPTTDLFTFTRAGLPWTNQSWLAQAGMYLAYRAGGLPLIIFVHTLAIATGYGLLQMAALRATRGQVAGATLATLAAAMVGFGAWNVRPQTVSFTLFGALIWLLEAHRSGWRRALWLLPPLFALWSNLHGGFVFGIGVLGLYALACTMQDWQRERRPGRTAVETLAVTAMSVLALAVNPIGPLGIARYVLGFIQSDATRDANLEFMPLSIRTLDGQLFVAVALLLLGIAYWRRRPLPLYSVLSALALGLFSLYSRRVEPWFGMALAPLAACLFASPLASSPGKRSLNYTVVGLLSFCALASLPWLRPYLPLPAERRAYVTLDDTPEQAVRVLCGLGGGTRVFDSMGFGSYMTWACPSVPVFIDTRMELYPSATWEEYLEVQDGRYDWQQTFQKYGINTILIHKQQAAGLVAAASASPEWRTIYEDEHAILFQRDAD